MIKRRGGYSCDKVHALKVRVSPWLFKRLQEMAEQRRVSMALLLRELLAMGLEVKQA